MTQNFRMRSPAPEDAVAIYELLQPYKPYVGTSPLYTYLLICEHFSETSLVVEDEARQIIAFTSAFIPPRQPNTLFLWEIAVKEGFHGNNLYIRMVREICSKVSPAYVEATVNPSNDSSIRRLQKLSDIFGSECRQSTLFPSEYFGAVEHEDEDLYRIGPIEYNNSETRKTA